MPSPLFVGIDVSSEANTVCCLTRDDEKPGEQLSHDQLVSQVQ